METLSNKLMSNVMKMFEGEIGYAFTDGKDKIQCHRFFHHRKKGNKDYELNLEHTFTQDTFDEDWKIVEKALSLWLKNIKEKEKNDLS